MLSSKASSFSIFVIICIIASVPSISSDIFVPSIPAISQHFAVSMDKIQLTISTLMCSFAISQLIYGPVSAAYGRKYPLLFGLVLVCAGTVICSYAQSIQMLTFGQILEGFGLGSCSLYRAMLRDCYDGKELRIKSGTANLIMTLFIPAAPMIGGLLQDFIGWQANFVFLAILSLVCILLVMSIPETNLHRNPDQLSPPYVIKVYHLLLTHNAFVGYSLCSMLAMAGYFAWVLTIPLYIINYLHFSPADLGLGMLLVSAFSIFVGGSLNHYLAHRYSTESILVAAWIYLAVISCFPIMLYLWLDFQAIWLYAMMGLYFFGTAFLWPNLFTKAFAPFQHLSGQAGSLYGNAQTMGGFFAALLMGATSESNPFGLCVILIVVNLLSLLLYFLIIAPHQRHIQPHI
ncbi:MAG: hypothetical protein CMF43_03625 [Legionellales bacterium]|nr:hypothetical protein [Legionellales bacterium]